MTVMYDTIHAILNSEEKADLQHFLNEFRTRSKPFFLRNEILEGFSAYCTQSFKPPHFYHVSLVGKLMHATHELLLEADYVWFLVRTQVASQEVLRLQMDLTHVEPMTPQALLDLRDRLVQRYQPQLLEIDLRPFHAAFPKIQDPRSIGKGFEFLNRYLCNELFTEPDYWQEQIFNALRGQHYDGIQLLINQQIRSASEFLTQVDQALHWLGHTSPDIPYAQLHWKLQELGFEPGWGNTAGRVRETLELLTHFVDMPNPSLLEAFVARLPIVFRVVLVSIHGWVAQEGILGRSETMGQVVYVLDQARNLENQLQREIRLAGLEFLGIQPQVVILTRLIPNCEGTSCNLRLEQLHGTRNGWILRVPFREGNPKMTQNWMPRSEIWAYLEDFALDAEAQLLSQLQGPPNLILGNYSDGNLVAFLLSRRLKTSFGSIAHSLEKPKHLFSDLYWQDLEPEYHFSMQFTADLISMNAADFVLSSSCHEIVGTPDTVGQYESYKCFSMPQLYHVVDGVDLFSPRFNVIPPGVNEHLFFPYSDDADRPAHDRQRIEQLLFTRTGPQILGYLDDPQKRPLLMMTSINSIKNPSGFIECFGRSAALRDRCNLIMVTNKLQPGPAANPDEIREIERLYQLLDQYQLKGQFRWIGMRLSRAALGEVYRSVADRRGIFVQPARFEAFGLTLLEAMISGLPTFATQFGGPAELIQDGENGFHINPMNLEETAQKLLNFVEQCDRDPSYWQLFSQRAIERVHTAYNWQLHVQQLLCCSKIESFWSYVYRDPREALLRYLEALYYLIFKPRAEALLREHQQR